MWEPVLIFGLVFEAVWRARGVNYGNGVSALQCSCVWRTITRRSNTSAGFWFMKLAQAINEFRDWRGFKVTGHTVVRYDHVLRTFCLCMGNPDIEFIKIHHVLGYMKQMQELGWAKNGINIVALALRMFFKYFNMQGFDCIDEELIPLQRKEFKMPRVANEADFKKLAAVIPNNNRPHNLRNRALLNMIWDSYARIGEILSLDEDDLKTCKDGTGSATIKTEKSRGRRPIREIFWTAKTNKYLKKWLRKKHELEEDFDFDQSEAVFISISKCRGYNTRGSRMTGKNAAEVLRTLSNQAKLPYVFNAHSARHHGGREIIKRGGSNSDVSNILGHSNIESSAIYTMMVADDLKDRWTTFQKRTRKRKKKLNDVFHGSLKNPHWGKRD